MTRFLAATPRDPATPTPFDHPGVDPARVRAALPTALVRRLEELQELVEGGHPLDRDEDAELHALGQRAAELTTTTIRETLDRRDRRAKSM